MLRSVRCVAVCLALYPSAGSTQDILRLFPPDPLDVRTRIGIIVLDEPRYHALLGACGIRGQHWVEALYRHAERGVVASLSREFSGAPNLPVILATHIGALQMASMLGSRTDRRSAECARWRDAPVLPTWDRVAEREMERYARERGR
jgi:hypothetical protein